MLLCPSRFEPVLNALVIDCSGSGWAGAVSTHVYSARVAILLSLLLLLAFVPGYDTMPPGPRLRPAGQISATPVALDPDDPARRTVGWLTYLGGVALDSRDPAFGGFSSMTVVGDRFTLLSDGGGIVQFRMGPDWHLGDVRFANLPDGPGTGWEKRDRDSESMAVDPATGTVWVGFETYNSIWRYAAGFRRAEARVRPPAMADWPVAGGPESMVRLRDGGMVVLSETGRWPHHKDRAAIRFTGDPVTDPRAGFRFSYRPPAGYDPSDAVALPGGDLLVLNRRFRLPYQFTAILTIVPHAAIAPGKTVTGTPIARFAPPLIHDNFEALAVTREAGRTIVWMASDDNQSMLQRSLLLKFRLDRPGDPRG